MSAALATLEVVRADRAVALPETAVIAVEDAATAVIAVEDAASPVMSS